MYYGITRFTVQKKQNILVTVKESTKEEVLRSIKNNKLDSVKIDISKPETGIIEGYKADSLQKDTLKTRQQLQMEIMEKPCDTTDTARFVNGRYYL